jgi:hypothetical protein
MHFEWKVEGPAEACGKTCRTWVSATGAITAETPRHFEIFAKAHDLRGATIALDSDGGSVLGALALGRAIRRLEMATMVGKTVDIPSTDKGERRARLMPRAYCESMCAFVLLAGVERQVPGEARVLVHQIWLGDRRDDPTAANYSAEDLVLVQRDIGKLAMYTIEMGGTIDLVETALKIPPWEPMRLLSREELRGMKLVTVEDGPEVVPVSTASAAPPPALASGSRVVPGERNWVIGESPAGLVLARKHPLTVEGDDIGGFELSFGCGEPGRDYIVTYVEHRRGSEPGRAPEALTDFELSLSGKAVPLKIVSSRSDRKATELDSVASGRVSADLIKAFADPRSRSMTIETTSEDMATAIRIGNAGVARVFQRLAAACGAQVRTRSTELRPAN